MAGRPNKLAFLNQAPPPNYVAGLGRGASGFTTRSDIGPARIAPGASSAAGGAPGAASKSGAGDGEQDGQHEDAEQDPNQDPENETGLFAGGVYERDDEEADRIWDAVDQKMDERRRKRREEREKQELEKLRAERPKIQAQFADLKRGLSSVTDDEWANLPEATSLTGKRRKKAAAREARDTRSVAVPDSVLLANRDRNAVESSISANDGTASSLQQGVTTSLTEIGEARNKIFSHKLDQAGTQSSLGGGATSGSSSLAGSASSIDPKGYLTELSSMNIQSSAEIGDIKKARSLLDSVIKTNPKHGPGWIAAARLEEVAGKMAAARKIIAQGCEHCPKSEDVWLENARLNVKDNAKVVLARAVTHINQSVKIWLKAAELEDDANAKKRVIRKSLEYIPSSVVLWKELVNLEESPEDARILLSGAVEAVPSAVELWLALARLTPPADAQKVLNAALRHNPTSHVVWIAALRLIEQTMSTQREAGDDKAPSSDAIQSRLDVTMRRAVESLRKAGAVLSREEWLREAEQVEREGSPGSCAAIIKATIALDVEEEDRSVVWVEDAQACLERGSVESARAILAYTLNTFPEQHAIWRKAVDLEKRHGGRDSVEALLERAVTACPRSEVLWLMYAKEKWQGAGDVAGAREVLIRAFDKNLGSEEISLAAAKLEAENGQKKAAQLLLQRARQEVGSARVWLKSAVFERDEGRPHEALALVREALAKFQQLDKLHLMHAQLLEATTSDSREAIRQAREAFAKGIKACPQSVPLHVEAARLEERAQLAIRARAVLEKARLLNPRNERLWYESVRVEERAGNAAQAKTTMARALQECPSSGLLWAASIWMEPRPARKSRSADALKRTADDARVLCAVARLFWAERKPEQARKWFERATRADADWGDGWAWWYGFEAQHGTPETRERVASACVKAEPRHGEMWQPIWKRPLQPKRQQGEQQQDHARRSTLEVLRETAAALPPTQ